MDLTTMSSSAPAGINSLLATTVRSMQRIVMTEDPQEWLEDLLKTCASALQPLVLAVYRLETEQIEPARSVLWLDRDLTAVGLLKPEDDVVIPDTSTGSTGWVKQISQGNVTLVSVGDLPKATRTPFKRSGWRSFLAVPIVENLEVLRVLLCASENDADAWSEETRTVCDLIASAISLALLREKALHYDRLKAMLAYSSDIIAVVGPDGTLLSYTPEFAQVLDGAETSSGLNTFESIHPEDQTYVRKALDELLDEPGGQRRIDLRLRQNDGSWRQFEATGTNQVDNPLIGGIVVTAHDVTERKSLEDRLNWQALHDPLTGLPNRLLLLNDLRRALARSERSGEKIGLLYLDLDGFKQVNDHFGHSTGDQLLARVSERLRICVRSGETVARMGGDEFIILLEGLKELRDAELAASRILDVVRIPVPLNTGTVAVTASIGISITSGEILDPDELLIRADSALYAAKSAGRNQYQSYEPRTTDDPPAY